MEKREFEMLLRLRSHIIEQHSNMLKESGGQNTAIVSARDAITILSTIVNSIDDILRPHVNFSKE